MGSLPLFGNEMESGDKSPSEQQSPFWESAQAPQSAASPQPEAQSVSPPQAQMVGNVAQQQSTQFSPTVNNPALNGSNIGSASSITTGDDMTEKKKGMNWKQFAIGFFAPIAIMILLSILSEVTAENWDDNWDDIYREEIITIFSDNGTFSHTFDEQVTDNGRMESSWCSSTDTYEGYDYYCSYSHSSGDEVIEIVERKNGGSEVAVGEYNELNYTIWLTTDSHSSNEMQFVFEFYDSALEEEMDYSTAGSDDLFEGLFCLMPLIGIVAIIVSFAKGNKSLGFGLVSSMSIPFILGGLFLMLLLMFGF